MGNKDKCLILTLACPGIGRVSQVVEDALQDALLSVLTHGESIEEGLQLGAFAGHLTDQIYQNGDYFGFAGSEQEHWNYARDPYGCFNEYMREFDTALAHLQTLNRSVIDLTQRAHWKCQLRLVKRLPNHWIIAVEGG